MSIQTVEQPALARTRRLSSREEPVATAAADGAPSKPSGVILMRSTGLGKAELVAEICGVKRQRDYLIMELRTTAPVRWKVRVGVSHVDLRMLLRAMAKASVLRFLLNVRAWFRPPAHPGDF